LNKNDVISHIVSYIV